MDAEGPAHGRAFVVLGSCERCSILLRFSPMRMPTDQASAERALADIAAEQTRLANRRHKLTSEWPRPADFDGQLAEISGRQAELRELDDKINSEWA